MATTSFRKHGLEHIEHQLSATQRAVAELEPSARAVVYGAPGSGKTTALKALYLNLIKKGLHAHNVLALTANRDAANLLRDELALANQGATAGPMARTLASFAFSILRQDALETGTRSPELINGSEQDRILKQLLEDEVVAGLSADWPKQVDDKVLKLAGFRAELRELFTVCLERGVSATELRALGEAQQIWVAASNILEKYQEHLATPANDNRHDPSTLLTKAAELLEAKEWATFVTDIKLVIVDDAQELTPGAKHLLKVLVSKGAGLVLLGDPDSATLGFRSADPQSMRLLIDDVAGVGGAKTIMLEQDHKVRPEAISVAMANISKAMPPELAGPQRKVHGATNLVPGEEVEGKVFDTATSESAWVARRLRELHLNDGVAWGDMAVVARSRNLLENFGAALAAESVPSTVLGSKSALRDEYGSGALLRLAQYAIEQPEVDYKMALELLQSPFCDLDSLGLRRFRRQLRQADLHEGLNRTGDELVVELFNKPGTVATLESKEATAVNNFIAALERGKTLVDDPSKTAEDLLWHFWAESKPMRHWPLQTKNVGEVAQQAGRNLDAVVALFAAANRYVERNPNGSIAEFVNDQLTLDLPQDTLAVNARDDERVLLLTSAALIGRRFKVVVIPQLIEGVWPNLKPRSSLLGATILDELLTNKPDIDRTELPQELRLLNKAVGAATERVIVTSVDGDESQISQFVSLVLGSTPDTETYGAPRYTLRGTVGRLRRTLVTAETEVERLEAAYGLARLAAEGIPGANPEQWYGILDLSTDEALVILDGDKQVYVAPSQLDDFLKCPLHWFIKHHGGREGSFEANFGILLHKVLEETASNDEAALWRGVESKWHTLDFEAEWLEKKEKRKARKMVTRLASYLATQDAAGYEVIGREVKFNFQLGNAYVSGTVDRIERNAEGKVMIVDLKTGDKISKEEVKTHPQLGLYQLAFEQKAFGDLIAEGDTLEGARLVFVASDKSVYDQEPINVPNAEYDVEYFAKLLEESAQEMAMEKKLFIANVGNHCNSDRYGACTLQVIQAVSYVD
ncbi:MAG: ATP-dependent DNA helicase [Rhodoluna sp.]|nr:ATP-dependent DNA helicase [Rhodoluna sp.]